MSIIKLEESIAQTVVDGLDLGVVLKGVRAELAADTGLLETSEGNLVGEHVVAVDPDGSMCLLASGFDSYISNMVPYPARRALETRMAVVTSLVWIPAARPRTYH